MVQLILRNMDVPSDNQTRADNQQGRLHPWYIVGFTDGEGCFSISIFRNATTRLGYQAFPEFVITQGAKSVTVLEEIQSYFGCGQIYENRRIDNHRENLHRYCVRSLKDIQEEVIPFFEQYRLRTNKRFDFETFCLAVDMIAHKEHLNLDGLDRLRSLAATMNRQKTRI
jgi:hypothetical protein